MFLTRKIHSGVTLGLKTPAFNVHSVVFKFLFLFFLCQCFSYKYFPTFFIFQKKVILFSLPTARSCSESDAARSPPFVEFLRSLSLPSFSPGIACCVS